ncbi:hypothetical protein ACN261_31540 [Micromonospora sp. WMMD723]|uniref:hypothetical protein n=1 Tax=Micromonospora sp. WMMD723 TaxID=3403465 RepID=UPI003CF700C1
MTARRALPVLYGLCDEWTARRQMLAALGGEPDQLTDTLTPSAPPADAGPAGEPTVAENRAAEIAALAAAFR